jgi:hypothetical protein
MGKKAKLKKMRKSEPLETNSKPIETSDRDSFVRDLERHGYSLKRIQRAPEVPNQSKEPQV